MYYFIKSHKIVIYKCLNNNIEYNNNNNSYVQKIKIL